MSYELPRLDGVHLCPSAACFVFICLCVDETLQDGPEKRLNHHGNVNQLLHSISSAVSDSLMHEVAQGSSSPPSPSTVSALGGGSP